MRNRDSKRGIDKVAERSRAQSGPLPFHRSPKQAEEAKLQAEFAEQKRKKDIAKRHELDKI